MAKNFIITSAFVLALICPVMSYAQSNFSGPFVQTGIGYGIMNQNSHQNLYAANGTTLLATSNLGNLNTVLGTMGAGYYSDVGHKILLGVGADFLPGASASASYTVNSTIGLPPAYGSTQFKNGRNFYASAGYAVSENSLIYAKYGYTLIEAVGTSALLTASDTLKGYSLGLGYRQIFTQKIYGFLEWKYARFHAVTSSIAVPYGGTTLIANSSGQPSGNDLILGIGYAF